MTRICTEKLYLEIKARSKRKAGIYKEEIHCPLILEVMANEGTMTAFCKKISISDALFYDWVREKPMFKDCYEIGKMISKANWEKEGEEGRHDENFNMDYWRITGACRYGVGRSNRIRMAIDPEASPYEQYKQLVRQANGEEFTASEVKQLMESINVGRGAFETFKLQERIDSMEENVKRMEINNVNDSRPIEKA